MRTLLWLTWVAALGFGLPRAQGTGWALALLAFGGLTTLGTIRWCVHDAYQTAVKAIAVLLLFALAPITLGNWAGRQIERSQAPDDLEGVSYAELRESLPNGVIDPVGGERIFARRRYHRGGWDHWYKMTIDEVDYRAMWAAHWTFIKVRMPTARPLADDVRAIPRNWPAVGDAPDWFTLPYESRLEWGGWERQIDTRPGDSRACGAVWAYDHDSGSLYIWDWNSQHCDLGW